MANEKHMMPPSAKEFIQHGLSNPPYIEIDDIQFKGSRVLELVENYALWKARFHVEAALKAAQDHIDLCYRDKEPWPDSVLNAYPLTNIK